MYKQVLKQASVATVASATVSGKVQTAGTIHGLLLYFKTSSSNLTWANLIADVTRVVAKINGETIVDASVQHLADLFNYYNAHRSYKSIVNSSVSTGFPYYPVLGTQINAITQKATANYDLYALEAVKSAIESVAATGVCIPVMFDRPDLPTDAMRQTFALGMKDVSSFTVDLTCGASVNTAAHVGNVDIFAIVSPQNRVLGQHVRILQYNQSVSTATFVEVNSLPKNPRTGYLAIHQKHTASTVLYPTDVTVKIGGRSIYDQVPTQVSKTLGVMSGRAWQVGYHHVDFALSRDVFNLGFLPMIGVQDFRVQSNFASDPSANSGALELITEQIYGLNVK